jgi:hypothetical protein
VIFKPELVHLVLSGKKTQTRRPIKTDEVTCRYRVGHTYAVQPKRGARSKGRIQILAASRQRLGDLTDQEAKAEGFPSRVAFFRYWAKLYERVDHDEQVWAIAFVPAEPVRYLAKNPSRPPVTNTQQAARADRPDREARHSDEPEPEMVPAEYQEVISHDASERFGRLREREIQHRDVRQLSDKLRNLGKRATQSGADLSEEIHQVQQLIEQAEGKLKEAA